MRIACKRWNMRKSMIIWIIITILCAVYGICIKSIGSGTRFYLVWFAMGITAFGCAISVQLGLWNELPNVAQKGIIAITVVVIAIFLFIEGCVVSMFGKAGVPDLDYVIVLGAQMKEEGPSLVLKHRLDRAITYLKENPDTICIVSGGQGRNEPCTEAAGMKKYLVKNGISEDRILEEGKSLNTVQNMKYSVKFLDNRKKNVGIITNNFHLFRAIRLARKQGIENVYGISAKSTAFYLPNNMLREFFGIIKDFFAGNL